MPTTPDRQKPQRLSPGVYRGPKGQLQTSSGRQLPRPATPPGQAGRLVDAMNQAPQQGQIATRPPAPLGTPAGAPQQDGQGSAPIGNMMGQMPQMSQADMNQFMQNYAYEQPQRPNSITGLLQRGGQQQQPMMQNPQMNMPMPELSFEQWKQMQTGQNGYGGQMPQLQPGEQYAQQSPEEYAATLAKKQAFAQQQQGFGMANRMFKPGMNPQSIQRQMGPVQLPTTEAEYAAIPGNSRSPFRNA
jgi:hypothetical protein